MGHPLRSTIRRVEHFEAPLLAMGARIIAPNSCCPFCDRCDLMIGVCQLKLAAVFSPTLRWSPTLEILSGSSGTMQGTVMTKCTGYRNLCTDSSNGKVHPRPPKANVFIPVALRSFPVGPRRCYLF